MRRLSSLPLLLAAFLTAAVALWPVPARADGRHHGVRGSVVVVGGYAYDPFWGPGWGPGGWGGPWGPYGYPYDYPFAYDRTVDVRILATPKDARVYVDGYYAGIVDDFDGIFQRLSLPPGGHEITLYRDGYRTVTRKVYLEPHNTFKLHESMERLGPGESSAPPPPPTAPPPASRAPQGRHTPYGPYGPRGPRVPPQPPAPPTPGEPPAPGAPPPPEMAPSGEATSSFGALSIRVQPPDAEVLIDGEQWNGSSDRARLVVQVSDGTHHVEVRKDGFRPFEADVDVRAGETRTLNISLSRE